MANTDGYGIFDRSSGWGFTKSSYKDADGTSHNVTTNSNDGGSGFVSYTFSPESHSDITTRADEMITSYTWANDTVTLVNGVPVHHLTGTAIAALTVIHDYESNMTSPHDSNFNTPGTFTHQFVRDNDPNDRSSGWGHGAKSLDNAGRAVTANSYHD